MTHAHDIPQVSQGHVHPPYAHAHQHPHGAPGHPAQPVPSSLLRMPLTSRLTIAVGFIAVLWTIVLLAMR